MREKLTEEKLDKYYEYYSSNKNATIQEINEKFGLIEGKLVYRYFKFRQSLEGGVNEH